MVKYFEHCLPLYRILKLFEEFGPRKFFHYDVHENKKCDIGSETDSDCLYEQRFESKID